MINVNIGGKIFVTAADTLTRWGANKFSEDLEWNKGTKNLFYDRDPKYADTIINHMRGYHICPPDDKKELYMLYEDAKFFKIKTLENELFALLYPPKLLMTVDDKKHLINWIRKKILDLNIEQLTPSLKYVDKLTDDEIINMQTKIITYEKEFETKKLQESLFQVCLIILRWCEQHKSLHGITSRFMKDITLAKKLISDVVSTNDYSLLKLIIYIVNIVFEKKITM